MMHADPAAAPGQPKGFTLFFNPTNASLPVAMLLPVYYCGFDAGAAVTLAWMNGTSSTVPQDSFFNLPVDIVLPPRGFDWVALS
jgi:hypothetical protein